MKKFLVYILVTLFLGSVFSIALLNTNNKAVRDNAPAISNAIGFVNPVFACGGGDGGGGDCGGTDPDTSLGPEGGDVPPPPIQ